MLANSLAGHLFAAGSWARVEGGAARLARLDRSNREKLATAKAHYRSLPPEA